MTSDASHRDDLTRLVFDGSYEQTHADIKETLLDPIFDAREGLTLREAGLLAYERSRFLHGKLERPTEIVRTPRRLFALAEWPSLLDVSTFSLLMVHYNLCFGTVLEHGADRPDVKDYVDELDGLKSFGPYMATELGYGNNVAALRTEAVYDRADESFVLNTPDPLAQKFMSYSGFGDIPKIAVVMARLIADGKDHGVFPFLVRISDEHGLCEGVHAAACPEKPVQGLDNGVTWFDHVRIPRRNLLMGDMAGFDEDGTFRPAPGNQRKRFLRAMSRIQPGRLCVSSSAVGAGRASVYIALRYAAQRLTNAPGRPDTPIIEYRSHQAALFPALAKVYAMTFLLNHAKREFLRSPHDISADLNNLISITKALSTWEMTDVIATCRERCGAQGIFSANRIADYGSLLQGLVTAEGDNQVLLATTAAQMLAGRDATDERTVPAPGGRDLLEPGFHSELLHYREDSLLRQARTAMTDGPDDQTYFDAWNGNVNTALDMARTKGVRIALEHFRAAADDARSDVVRTALGDLASLYALTEIDRHSGWYLARGAMTGQQVKEIPARIDGLCVRLLPHASMLIDGFQLTPELLRAPIAADDYVSAFQRLAGAAPATAPVTAERS
ncbi:acyl-CoA dehydrogenase family protein [Streptomyces purpurogeneiscleroticus]|uniref:acyl-CoA dehydrogenase family protein n=1 Tax=Streptomyces purpurogeneiscleroticus TaxID=68259 RepID=UPI001CBDE883|nr:acyl-CoA dehydrogenase [Streptomyces purpurogeneiscleroticus]